MRNIIFIVTFTAIASISCSRSEVETKTFNLAETKEYNNGQYLTLQFQQKDFSKAVSLNGVKLGLGELLGQPNKILFQNSKLIITDTDPKNMIQVIDPLSLKSEKSLGIKGFGPMEMMSTWTLSRGSRNSEFWIFDIQQQRLNFFDQLSDQKSPILQIPTKSDSSKSFYSVTKSSDTTFIGISRDGQAIFSEFDTSGGFINGFGNLVDFYSKKDAQQRLSYQKAVQQRLLAQLFQGQLYNDTSLRYFVLLSLSVNAIHILDLETTKIVRITGPGPSTEPNYTVNTGGGMPALYFDPTSSRYTYLYGFVSDSSFWFLYSGNVWDGNPAGAYFGTEIFEFKIDGTPSTSYQLDIPIKAFTVDTTKKIIYGLTTDEDQDVAMFKY